MNQVRQVSPCLAFGARLITYDKTSTGDPAYGANILESIQPFVNSANGIQLFFDSLRSKSSRSTSPYNMTELEVTQLVALLHSMSPKVTSLTDFCNFNQQWVNEIMIALRETNFFDLLGQNGHKGIENRHIHKLINQMMAIILQQWLQALGYCRDVQTANIDEIESHVLAMQKLSTAIHSSAAFRTAVLLGIHAAAHSLICDECSFGIIVREIVANFMMDFNRKYIDEPLSCGETPFKVHTKYPGMTKLSVPPQYKLLSIFDAPERRTVSDKVMGIGMKMIPSGYAHLIAYERNPLIMPTSYYHIDLDPAVPNDIATVDIFDLSSQDAHVHIWVNSAGIDTIPISSMNPVVKEMMLITPGEQIHYLKLSIVLLSLIDGLTSLALQIKSLAGSKGELSPSEWTPEFNGSVSSLYMQSKLPGLIAVQAAIMSLTPREKELTVNFIASLASEMFTVIEIGKWEFSQRYLKHQLDALKNMRDAPLQLENLLSDYLSKLLDLIK